MEGFAEIFPDAKNNLLLVAKPNTNLRDLCETLGFTDSVLTLSAWLCVVLSNENLKLNPEQVRKHQDYYVGELVAIFKQHGYAPHPEALMADGSKTTHPQNLLCCHHFNRGDLVTEPSNL